MEELDYKRAQPYLDLLSDPSLWIHRRVESVTLVDASTVRRRVSIDLTIPPSTEGDSLSNVSVKELVDGSDEGGGALRTSIQQAFVPLALLRKEALTNLDVRNESGRPLPVLTREQNSDLAARFLLGRAKRLAREDVAEHSDELLSDLFTIASAAPGDEELALALAKFTDPSTPTKHPTTELYRLLYRDDWFRSALRNFRDNFALVALVDVIPGDRRILKFSADMPLELEHNSDSLDADASAAFAKAGKSSVGNKYGKLALRIRNWPRVHRALTSIGFLATEIQFDAPAIAECGSYHFECASPAGLDLIDSWIVAYESEDSNETTLWRSDRCNSPQRRIHLFVNQAPGGSSGKVALLIRPSRIGWLRGALSASIFVFLTLAFMTVWGHFALFTAKTNEPSYAAAAVILAIPGFLAASLARPGEHQLASRLLLGSRISLVAAGLLSFFSAGLLVMSTASKVPVWLWWVVFGLSTIPVIILGSVNSRARSV